MSMAYARQRNTNSFGILDLFNPPPPNELCQVLPQQGKPVHQNPILVSPKLHSNVDNRNLQQPHNPVYCQNGNTRPGFVRYQAPSQKQDFLREKPPNCYPAPVGPPRFQNRPQVPIELCGPPSLQCGAIDPCLSSTPMSEADIRFVNAGLRQHLQAMQRQPAPIPVPMLQPIGSPLPPNAITQPVPVLPGSNENIAAENNTLSSTPTPRTAGLARPSHIPEVSCTPMGTNHLKELPMEPIPPPPGLSKRPQQPHHVPEPASHAPTGVNHLREPPKEPIPPPPGLSKRPQQPHHVPEPASRTPTGVNHLRAPPEEPIPPPPGLSRRVQQSPRIPEVDSRTRTPTNAADLMEPSEGPKVSLPPPPGLPRRGRGGRFGNRDRRHANGERRFDQAMDTSNFERHNGVREMDRVISPPLFDATPNLKLPPSKNAQSILSSPATSVSSLTEDFSGSSSAPFGSDTTFTSVDSNVSDKVSERPVQTCRNWVNGYPCHRAPCRFFHPPRPNRPGNTATTQSPSALQSSGATKKSTDAHVQTPSSATQPANPVTAQSPSAPPPSSNAIQNSVDARGQTPNLAPHPPRPNRTVNQATDQSLSVPPRLPVPVQKSTDARGQTSHPTRSHQSSNPATVQSHPMPSHPSGTTKISVDPRDQTSRTRDPPNVIAEPPRPEPLYATTISDHIKVRFDQGFEVREVVTGFESRWVHIGNVARSVTSAALSKLLSPYKVDSINLNESSGKSTTAKVQFMTAEDAMKAVTELNGTEFFKKTITAKLAINNSLGGGTVLTDTDVQLVWECPFRVGYAGYDTLKEARVALDTLNGFPMEYSVVSAQLYEGLPCVGAYNVMFKHLPASVNEQSLRKFAKSNAVMLERPNYQYLDRAIHSIRSRLEEYGAITRFDVIPAPYKDGMVKAWAHFTSPAEALAAQEDMDRRRPKTIGHTILSCRHVVSVSHTLSFASYRRMREDIGWLRWSWQRRYGSGVSIREKFKENASEDAPAFIRLSSDQPELLSVLKYEFEQLLHGETVTFSKKPAWDDFLISEAGRTYIAQLLAQYPGIEIQVQKTRRVVSLWGPVIMRHRARQDIVRKIVELKAQQFWKIPLSGKLLGVFCSAELSTLQELLGAENCIMDFGERVLVVRGNDLAFRTACDVVQSAQSRQSDELRPSDHVCPVCFGEAVVPVSLACGHQWCRACLTGYLASAVENKMFPLKCLGNDATCTQCIPLGLSRKLLSAADFNAVIEAAFWVYIHSRPDEFHHCPTPDCTQVYRSAPPNSVLQCPSCLIRLCPACRIEYHDGMTCEERDVAEDKLFNEWSANHDVKSCPGCKAPIERSEGCNHMTCTRCQTHICWECMATFPRGQGIYDHMRNQHGGIGL